MNFIAMLRKDCGAVSPLTAAEELELLLRRPDTAAVNALVCRNMGLLVHTAAKYGGELDDLVTEAVLGYMEGIHRWDASHGCRLNTYALSWVHKYLQSASFGRRETLELTVDIEEVTFESLYGPDEMEAVVTALGELPPRWRTVIEMRFFEHKSLSDIGLAMNLSKERIRQLEEKAIDELRRILTLE